MNATKPNDPWTDDLIAALREQALGSPSYGSLMLHAADRIDNLESLLAEKQRQCDCLTDRLAAIDKLTCNCPCMSLQAQHEFERNAESEAYRVSLAQLILAIREQARALRDGRAEP